MPEVLVSQRVALPPADVFAILADMEAFPSFMPSVESVTVVERSQGRTVTDWVTHLAGSRFAWREEDVLRPEEGRIAYRLLKGDLRQFEGEWIVTAADGGRRSDVSLSVRFAFGLPMLAGLLDPVAKVMLRRNVEGMLRAIAGRAAQAPAGAAQDGV